MEPTWGSGGLHAPERLPTFREAQPGARFPAVLSSRVSRAPEAPVGGGSPRRGVETHSAVGSPGLARPLRPLRLRHAAPSEESAPPASTLQTPAHPSGPPADAPPPQGALASRRGVRGVDTQPAGGPWRPVRPSLSACGGDRRVAAWGSPGALRGSRACTDSPAPGPARLPRRSLHTPPGCRQEGPSPVPAPAADPTQELVARE